MVIEKGTHKIIVLVSMALFVTSSALAGDSEYESSRNKKENERNKEYHYVSLTGTKYKYDLSKPQDRIKYEVDPDAQMKDAVNPRVQIDRGFWQYGGGSE
jgi:hypothetical protein